MKKEKMVNERGAKLFCIDNISLIENYDKAINDNTQRWDCHHRLEIDENKTPQQLIDEGRYYNVPASELIFLTHSEHVTLHNLNASEETKRKRRETLSKVNSGENHPMFGTHPSKETRKKRSESMKGQPWINNGKENKRVHPEQLQEYLENGYERGRLHFKSPKLIGKSSKK